MTLADWFRTAARLGLDGADVSVAHIVSRQPTDLRRLARQAGDAGVDVPMLVTYTDFTHPDPGYRATRAFDCSTKTTRADRSGSGTTSRIRPRGSSTSSHAREGRVSRCSSTPRTTWCWVMILCLCWRP